MKKREGGGMGVVNHYHYFFTDFSTFFINRVVVTLEIHIASAVSNQPAPPPLGVWLSAHLDL